MMAVPLSEVGRNGRLSLTFSSQCGRTLIRDVYSDGTPRQINLPRPRQFILTNTFSF